jgi:predicted permease
MHIPLLEGRMFTPTDFEQAAQTSAATKAAEQNSHPQSSMATTTSAAAAVSVLVNEAFIRRYFPNENPLGKRITHVHGHSASTDSFATSPKSRNWQIVGVVTNTKYDTLRRQIQPIIYVPFTSGGTYFELRSALDPHALIPTVRSVADKIDSNLPLSHIRTQTQVIDELLSQERMVARLSWFFGVLALLLACIGLYGLLSYEVSRRTREIGVRMALGAHQRDVLSLVVGQGIVLAMLGTSLGIGVAVGVTRYLASMLYDVRPNDPLTMIGVAVLLAIVALAACYIPARRAIRVDPMVALRHE